MLTEEERREIEEETERSGHWAAASLDALQIVQRHRGWVSDELLRETAEILRMTPDELDNVATFFSLIFRRPVGKHVILLCDSVSCWVMGYNQVREHLSARLGIGPGQTTADGLFTLLPVACLGACDRAPAMMIDEELYGGLNPNEIDRILATYQRDKA